MPETRDFPTAVIASLSTGVLLCKFGEMHEAAEYLMGHPIWSHHFGSKKLRHEMQRAVIEQCPGMPTSLADIEAEIGKVVKIRKGNGATAMHPMEGIPEGKPVIIIQPGEQDS